jgi:hypothetical protein
MYHLNMIKIFTVAAFVAATSTLAFASDDLNKGSVNWTDGYIDGVGYGTAQPSGNKGKDRIKARRVAEVTAQRTLLETIKGVKIDSMTTVENSMLAEDVIKTRVEGIVKGAHIIDEKLEWDGNAPTAMVKMRICMLGGPSECKGPSLVNALDLEKKPEPPFVPQKVLLLVAPPQPPQETPAVITSPPPVQPVNVYPFDSSKPVTGVVFVLEGRYFEKSLMPVVITYSAQDGPVTVYSAKIVKPAVIRTYGAVRYADTVDNALTISQVGKNVLVIPATDITKENMIVIKAQDAVKIKDTLAHGNDYLSDAKVVISGR